MECGPAGLARRGGPICHSRYSSGEECRDHRFVNYPQSQPKNALAVSRSGPSVECLGPQPPRWGRGAGEGRIHRSGRSVAGRRPPRGKLSNATLADPITAPVRWGLKGVGRATGCGGQVQDGPKCGDPREGNRVAVPAAAATRCSWQKKRTQPIATKSPQAGAKGPRPFPLRAEAAARRRCEDAFAAAARKSSCATQLPMFSTLEELMADRRGELATNQLERLSRAVARPSTRSPRPLRTRFKRCPRRGAQATSRWRGRSSTTSRRDEGCCA